jgi:hypothetical protein
VNIEPRCRASTQSFAMSIDKYESFSDCLQESRRLLETLAG